MGNQQLLLLVLGVIIVGVAIAVALNYFRANSIDTKRDLLANECATLASQAMEHYRMPLEFGGGGRKFTGWEIPRQQRLTESGNFVATVYEDSIIIIGTGNEIANNTDSIRVRATVLPKSFSIVYVN